MKNVKILAGILSHYAKSQDIIYKVYSDEVRIPKTAKVKIEIFSDIEIKTLFNNDAAPLVDTILIMIYSGMRIAELLTLTKFNVDIKSMLITGGIKTDAGKDRVIPIHPKIQKYIIARYNSAENYLIEYDKPMGNKKKGTAHTERKPYLYSYYKDIYLTTLESLGIRRITPHKARHTFTTMLSANCKDRKAMAMILGHTDPAFSERVYDHPDIDRLRDAMSSVDGFKHVSNKAESDKKIKTPNP
jgi:integrase